MSDEIYVTIAPGDSTDRLKITWALQGGGYHYEVPLRGIKKAAETIRKGLADLCREAREREGSKQKPDRVGPILRQMARGGNDLYLALLEDVTGNTAQMEEIQEHLQGPSKDKRIRFTLKAPVHAPWGLMYEADPQSLKEGPVDPENPDHYNAFACLGRRASTVYFLVRPAGGPRPQDSFRLLSVLDPACFDRAVGSALPAEQDFLKMPIQGFAATREELESQVEALGNKLGLVYFYCHADGTQLALGKQDRIDITYLPRALRRGRASEKEARLLFLNGCATAVGSPEGGFLEASGQAGFRGFIGTEAKVPDLFALRFGADFLHEFLHNGKTVIEVMNDLFRRHWPLSLLYQAYCNPDVSVEKAPNRPAAPETFARNFSRDPVGSHDMPAEEE